MRLSEFKIAKLICRVLGHKWDEFHVYEVVCSRCRTCRQYTEIDEKNFERKKALKK